MLNDFIRGGGTRSLNGLAFVFALENIFDQFDCLEPIHYRHVDVENDDVEVVHRVRGDNLNCLHSVLRYLDLKELFEMFSVHVNHQGLVIDKEHPRFKESKLLQAVFVRRRQDGLRH